jgi:hypothetical protein
MSKITAAPTAASVPFDNSGNGFAATTVQAAVEEAKNSATSLVPEVLVDPVGAVAGQTWVLKAATGGGTPIGLLLALTTAAYQYKLSYKTAAGSIVRTLLS